jgi:hypothetical protein
MLEADSSKSGGFHWRSDTTTKEALTQYSSGNLIDRDLAYFPRVTDGDFSGGGYQEIWLSQNKYFDSDLDPRIPGFLSLRPLWRRVTKPGLTVGSVTQAVAFASHFYYTYSEASGNIYNEIGATTTPGAGAIISLDSDGTYLYAGTASKLWRWDSSTWTAVTSSINGTATQWWVVNQGTNGYFAYYQSGPNLLYKIDLTQAFPIAAAAQPQVPMGSNAINIVDLVAYQTSISILTTDVRGSGSDVWYFDGANLTRILRIEGYIARGVCNALGALYVSAAPLTFSAYSTSPILIQVASGSYTVVAKPGSPFIQASGQDCRQPRASSQYVYWPLVLPSIKGISNAQLIIVQYDVITGAVTHLPALDTTDGGGVVNNLRQAAVLGDQVGFVYVDLNGTTGEFQYQTGTATFQTSGWLASSHIDFATPGIVKRFRRIEVHHAPLNAGEQILIEAFVDQDPLAFSTSLTPVPATATATNSTLNSTLTALTFGADTLGKTLYFALKLTAGTSNLTTPRVSYVSIEVGGTWAFEVWLACQATRTLLSGEIDAQGITAKDLAYLPMLAYEEGLLITLYHRNGTSYTCALESVEAWNSSPHVAQDQQVRDEEWIVHAVLRQVA